MRNNTVPISAAAIEMSTTLLMPGVMSFQRNSVLIGGKWKPRVLSPSSDACTSTENMRAEASCARCVEITVVVLLGWLEAVRLG